jgi:hypothetical protein
VPRREAPHNRYLFRAELFPPDFFAAPFLVAVFFDALLFPPLRLADWRDREPPEDDDLDALFEAPFFGAAFLGAAAFFAAAFFGADFLAALAGAFFTAFFTDFDA